MIKLLFKHKLIDSAIDYAFDIAIINLKYPELKSKNRLSRYAEVDGITKGIYYALRILEEGSVPQGCQGTSGGPGITGVFGAPYETLRVFDKPAVYIGSQGFQGTSGHLGTYYHCEKLI
jgi:hypothetical protein